MQAAIYRVSDHRLPVLIARDLCTLAVPFVFVLRRAQRGVGNDAEGLPEIFLQQMEKIGEDPPRLEALDVGAVAKEEAVRLHRLLTSWTRERMRQVCVRTQ